VLHRPHAKVRNIRGISRVVTLPDYQGLGLAFVLIEQIAAAHKALGYRFRNYPAHPSFVRAHDRSPRWALCKRPGQFSPALGKTSSINAAPHEGKRWNMGGRPCAVFEYVGDAMKSLDEARALIESAPISRAA